MGLGKSRSVYHKSPKKFNALSDIVSICCGELYTIALLDDGSIYCWGYNLYYQLGVGHYQIQNIPQKLNRLNASEIYSRFDHTFAFFKDDRSICSWGENVFNELELGCANGLSNFN